MSKYKTMFNEITKCGIKSETDKTVTLSNGSREKKFGYNSSYHDTWEQAHAHLLAEAQSMVDSLRLRLTQANGKLGQIKGMKPPESVR